MLDDQCNEEWRDMPETNGAYQVSSLGKARSIARLDSIGRSVRGRIMRFNLVKGYDGFPISVDSKQKTMLIHQVVASVFIGPCPIGMQVNHKDGNKRNNAASNLEYVTPGNNTRHAWAIGLCSAKGDRNGRSKLTPQCVLKIRAACKAGVLMTQIAKEFSIDPSTVSQIAAGKRWGHLTNKEN